jgi:hypothetical protein
MEDRRLNPIAGGVREVRLNNLSARLKVNEWLKRSGRVPLSSSLTYEEFASELRKITAKGQVQVPFSSRADAVAYIRFVASSMASN